MNEQNYKQVIRIERDSLCDGINKKFYRSEQYDVNQILSKITFVPEREVPVLIDRGILPSYANVEQTFLQNPFGETQYITLDDYESFAMRRKLFHIEHIAKLLGAKECSYEFHVVSSSKRKLDGNAHLQIEKGGKVNANFQQNEEKRLSQSISVSNTYSGVMPSIDIYQEANNYAIDHNITSNNEVQRLLFGRNPIDQNLLETMNLKVQLSEELNRNVDFAADLCAMDELIKIDTKFIEHVWIKNECVIDLFFKFAMP